MDDLARIVEFPVDSTRGMEIAAPLARIQSRASYGGGYDRSANGEQFLVPVISTGPQPQWWQAPATFSVGTADKARWAPDGKTIYFISNRDGPFFDLWGIGFDPVKGRVKHHVPCELACASMRACSSPRCSPMLSPDAHRPHVIRGSDLFSSNWLAALDDFHNWLIRETA